MSNEATVRMLEAYIEQAQAPLFLSSFFQSPERNFFNSESVEIDIMRKSEKVAPVITDLSVGGHSNSTDLYTNKRFTPPIHKEVSPLNVFDLIRRNPGVNPFEDFSFQANASLRAMNAFSEMELTIRRSNELQCSQVFQVETGVTLKDEKGNDAYTIDYKAKTTHFPTTSIAWSSVATATPMTDLENLADVIRKDNLRAPTDIIFGADAWRYFVRNTLEVQPLLDNRRMELGGVAPEQRDDGSKYMGFVEIGSYRVNMWTYTQFYDDQTTPGQKNPYVLTDRVIMLTAGARLDAVFGAIPRVVPVDRRILPLIPPRISVEGGGLDMFTNAWTTADGEQIFTSVGSRPLYIPTEIDSFGALKTTV